MSLEQLMSASKMRPTETAQNVVGFDSATFIVTVKKAALNSGGGFTFVAEVPFSDADAFYPVRKAFEVELVCTLQRKSTAR